MDLPFEVGGHNLWCAVPVDITHRYTTHDGGVDLGLYSSRSVGGRLKMIAGVVGIQPR